MVALPIYTWKCLFPALVLFLDIMHSSFHQMFSIFVETCLPPICQIVHYPERIVRSGLSESPAKAAFSTQQLTFVSSFKSKLSNFLLSPFSYQLSLCFCRYFIDFGTMMVRSLRSHAPLFYISCSSIETFLYFLSYSLVCPVHSFLSLITLRFLPIPTISNLPSFLFLFYLSLSPLTAAATITQVIDPEVFVLYPSLGPVNGGTAIYLTGKNLNSNSTSCRFGNFEDLDDVVLGLEATSSSVICESPPFSAGYVFVEVTTNEGTRFSSSKVAFLFTGELSCRHQYPSLTHKLLKIFFHQQSNLYIAYIHPTVLPAGIPLCMSMALGSSTPYPSRASSVLRSSLLAGSQSSRLFVSLLRVPQELKLR